MAKGKDFDLAIVGGGIAGLTLAIALYYRGAPVTIYEQAPRFGEIGAGVAFGPNAIDAMKVCHEGIHAAFQKVTTKNLWPSKGKVWFDYVNGMEDPHVGTLKGQEIVFNVPNRTGFAGVHRAHYLDELVKLVPPEIARFGRKLVDIHENSHNGKVVLEFYDGTTVEADAVLGCDGIKSRARQAIVGPNHPSALPVYTHKYAY